MWQHSPRWGNMPQHRPQMGQHSPKMGQHRRSGGIFAMPVLGRSKISEKNCFAGTVMRPPWPLGRAFLASILQHDPKTVQMGLMNDGSGSLFRPSGSVSWNLAGHYNVLVLDPSLPISSPGMAGAGRSPYNPAMPCSVSDVVA